MGRYTENVFSNCIYEPTHTYLQRAVGVFHLKTTAHVSILSMEQAHNFSKIVSNTVLL